MSQLRIGAVLSYANVAVSAGSALLVTPWIIRVLGIDQYGLYTLGLTVVSLFTLDFGLGEATARFLSKYKAEGDTRSARKFAHLVTRLYCLLDCLLGLVFLALYFVLPFIYRGLSESDLETFRSVFVIVSMYTVVTFPFIPLDGVLISSEKFGILKGIELGQKFLTLVVLILLLLSDASLFSLILGNVGVGLAATTAKIWLTRPFLPERPWSKDGGAALLRSLLDFTLWLGITGLLNRLVLALTPTLLAFASNAAQVGVFGAAAAIEGYVYVIGSATTGLFLPRITGILHSDDSRARLSRLMGLFGRFQLALVGTVYFGFVIFGRDFIDLWIGSEVGDVYWSVLILVAPSLLLIPLQLGRTALVAAGRLRSQTAVYAISAAVAIVITLLLASPYGAVGGAIGVACAYLVRALGLVLVYARQMDLDMRRFFKECFGRLFAVLLALGAVGEIVDTKIEWPGGWTSLLVRVGLFASISVVVIYRIGLGKDDRKVLRAFLPCRRQK